MTGRVVITGAGGFLGSNLAHRLAEGGATLDLISPRPEPSLAELPGARAHVGRAPVRVAELPLEEVSLLAHFASRTNSRLGSFRDEVAQLDELAEVLDLLAERGSPARLLFCSSGGTIYADSDRAHREEEPLQPRSSYAWGKVAAEALIETHGRRGRPYTILRCANPYGPRQQVKRQGLVMRLLLDLREGRETEVWGDGEELRDYVFVDDLNDLIETLAASADADGVFNVGSGVGVSVNAMAAAVERALGRSLRLKHTAALPNSVRSNLLDAERAHARFGWRATTSLEEGIQATWSWLEAQEG